MIILDTNVVSEPLKPTPDPNVVDWLNAQEPQTLYLTAISLAELLAGVEAMPAGRRRDLLAQGVAIRLATLFAGRLLAFDERAAQAFSKLQKSAQSQGNNIGFADCAIAAIASANAFTLATRNVRDFKGTGVELIDPWLFGQNG
jgi:predicted nucleic acid-binding protein